MPEPKAKIIQFQILSPTQIIALFDDGKLTSIEIERLGGADIKIKEAKDIQGSKEL